MRRSARARSLLLLHLGVEAVLVDLDALLGSDLLGQVDGEAEGIIQLEDVQALEQVLPCAFSRPSIMLFRMFMPASMVRAKFASSVPMTFLI